MGRLLGSLSAFIQQSEEDGYEMMDTDYPQHQPENFTISSHLSLFDDGHESSGTLIENRSSCYGETQYALQPPAAKVPAYYEPEGYESNDDDFFDTVPPM